VLWISTQLSSQRFLNPRPPRTRSKYNLHQPRSKFNPPRTRTQCSAGSRTRPANAGTCNPRGLTRPAEDSSTHAPGLAMRRADTTSDSFMLCVQVFINTREHGRNLVRDNGDVSPHFFRLFQTTFS